MSDLSEQLEQFDFEQWLDDEGIDYSIKAGTSGEQINIKTCPRCGGSQHKVFINRETGLGNCFHGSCVGEPGFNKFSFVRAYTGEENGVVVGIIKDQLAEQGWRPKPAKKEVQVIKPEEVILPESCELPINGRNLKYLSKRGITKETTELFGLRYCVEGFYWYKDYELKNRRQDYSKRLLIPVFNIEGELATFQGRDTTNTKDPKYLFPPMLPSTGRLLYNGQNSKGEYHLVMGEGAFDVMAIHQAIQASPMRETHKAIGSFGISFSTGPNQQLSELNKLIESGAKSLTFLWDGSRQAIKSAFKNAMEISARVSIPVKVAMLSDDKDPNEVDPSEVISAIERSAPANRVSYMRYMVNHRN